MLLPIIGCVVLIIALLLIHAVICQQVGLRDEKELGEIALNIISIGSLFLIALLMFSEILNTFPCLPFVDYIEEYGSFSDLFKKNPVAAAFECIRLVSLVLCMTYVSKLVPSDFGGKGFTKIILKSILIVLLGVIVNTLLLSVIQKSDFFAALIGILECIISGATLTVTPAMFIAHFLQLKPDSSAVLILLKTLPKSKIGKAISDATTNSIVFILALILFEKQCGSIYDFVNQIPNVIMSFLSGILVIFGITLMVGGLLRPFLKPSKK